MLFDLESVHFADVQGEDEPRDTTIDVHLHDEHGRHSGTIMEIMRAAGWKPSYVAFSRNRITFRERSQDE